MHIVHSLSNTTHEGVATTLIMLQKVVWVVKHFKSHRRKNKSCDDIIENYTNKTQNRV
jgi:hypothetical protein